MSNYKKNPLVSIIIPVYNGENYLKEAIESALAQTYKNIEIIVINDGSNDNTEKIALNYCSKIRYFSKENGGVASALNLGIQEAKGEYISWLSHDDKYYPNKIAVQIKQIKKLKNDNFILFSNYNRLVVNSNKTTKVKISYTKKYNNDKELFFESFKLLLNSTLHGCSLLIPKRAFNEAGLFDTKLKTVQDYAKWYEFLKIGYRFYHIDKQLILQRIHPSQDTNSKKDLHSIELEYLNNYAYNLFKNELGFLNAENKNYIAYKMLEKGYKNLYNNIKTLNVLLIGDSDLIGNKFNGHDLHLYLQEQKIEANHFVYRKLSKDKTTRQFAKCKSSKEYMENIIFSEWFQRADIIHLHLIHNTPFDLNYLPLITKLKPTVITLHDGFYLSGHCLHGFDCKKWQIYCKDCPYLDIPFRITADKSAFEFYLKKKCIQDSNIKAIVASNWMKEKFKNSPIWENKDIFFQPFGINQELFKKGNKALARKELNIPHNALVLMFRSDDSYFKGLETIKKALRELKTNKKIVLLTVTKKGLLNEFKNRFTIKEFDWIKEDNFLAKLYQASDLFLMPSTQEAFGMMAIEAMSCAIPVLSTTGTALQDVINSPDCGVAVEENQFSQELQRLINNPVEIIWRANNSYIYAKKFYDKNSYVNNIIKIYQEIISNHSIEGEELLVSDQLFKYEKNTKIQKRFKFADNVFWRLVYRLSYRVFLKHIYGKKIVKEKYDLIYL